jgi:antitoxin component HigA of HigAB toxin-antitoxin module
MLCNTSSVLYLRTMEINLIARNKIADYIQQHPEAQTVFLNWLKNFPYREAKSITRRIERSSPGEFTRASSPLNNGEYQIFYDTNYALKTAYISWLGTQKELEDYMQAEFEQQQVKNPGLEFRVKRTNVVLIPPPPMTSSIKHAKKTMLNTDGNSSIININGEVTLHSSPPYLESDRDYRTKVEYEQALNKAIAIFEAQPDTPEFEELSSLLPLIKHYEDTKLILPQLDISDVIRLTIKNFDLLRPILEPILGRQEEVDLFIAGKQKLPEETLKLICNSLGIRY